MTPTRRPKPKVMWLVEYDDSLGGPGYLYDTRAKAIDHITDDPWKPSARRVTVTETPARGKGK